jgi:hypothetical protein
VVEGAVQLLEEFLAALRVFIYFMCLEVALLEECAS